MLQDWITANRDFVRIENGKCVPRIIYADWGGHITYGADPDGLVATLIVPAADGGRAMLTVLFRMKPKQALKKLRAGQFPIRPNDPFAVTRIAVTT